MTFFANEYADIWEFSDEHPSPKNFPTYVNATVKVSEFVDIFLQPQFFGRIIIWEHKNWFMKQKIGKMINGFCVLDYLPETELFRHLIESEAETGHLSILFVPLKPQLFISEVLKSEHYKKPNEIELGTGQREDIFYYEDDRDFSFLESLVSQNGKRIFTFSHDAQFLYEIFEA